MALLIFLSFLLFVPSASAITENIKDLEVIYDASNPEASVGIYGEDLLEVGSLYEDYSVITFEPGGMIVRNGLLEEQEKWLENGRPSEELRRKARWLFIVKQMKAIYRAQIEYLEKFKDHYAPDLSDLINNGFLVDGFKDGKKEGYRFRIQETGETKRLAPHFVRESTFMAMAVPMKPEEDKYYFSVDQLGLVRYAESRRGSLWGPVWDYNEVNAKLSSRVIIHENENDEA